MVQRLVDRDPSDSSSSDDSDDSNSEDDDDASNQVELESTDKQALDKIVEMIKRYSQNARNYYSTLDIDVETNQQTLEKIKKFGKKRFGLVDVEVIRGRRITLKLIGFRH